MIQKPTDKIAKEDIESLVTAKVSERRTLDYKLQLPGGRDEDKREFLYDVSSFANAAGGDMVFGIADEKDTSGKATGLPASADGLALTNVSDAITRLENLVRDGIEPRIQGIQWQAVAGFSNGPVVVMRIAKSLIAPHMVVFGGMARFYSRNSTGKYPMDIGEIRSAFIESTAIGERLQAHRAQREQQVLNGASPLGQLVMPITVAHLIPLSSLAPHDSRDVTRAAARFQLQLKPITAGGWGGRYNFDGYLVGNGKSTSYVQVFRSGSIEAGDGELLEPPNMPEQYKKQIPSIAFERRIIEAIGRYLDVQSQLGIPLPVFVAITLLRVKGFTMSSGFLSPFSGNEEIDRNILQLPEVIVEDYAGDIGKLLQPAFDALWQACGIERSMNYDDQGNWRPHHT